MTGPTPTEAAALALYDAAEWTARYRDSMRRGSGQAMAAERIRGELLVRAQRRHLGDEYDPAINATEESLRRQIAVRGEETALADRLQRAATTAAFEEFDCSLAVLAERDGPWVDVGRKGAAAVVGELVDVLTELQTRLADDTN